MFSTVAQSVKQNLFVAGNVKEYVKIIHPQGYNFVTVISMGR
jgi:hypothetical protein